MLVTRDRLEFIYSDVNETALDGVKGSGETQAIAMSAYYNMNTYPGAEILIFVPNTSLVYDMFDRVYELTADRGVRWLERDTKGKQSLVRLKNGPE